MKKLICLLAVLVLSASAIFAATNNYVSGPSTSGFGAQFFCVPVLTAPGYAPLGNYFTSPIPTPIAVNNGNTVTWTLTGDPAATYQITLTDPLTVPVTIVIPGTLPTLQGAWTYTSATGVWINAPWWGTGFGGQTAPTNPLTGAPGGVVWPTTGSGPGTADLSCTVASLLKFTPSTITPGTATGTFNFDLTVTVNAQI